ncbi:hypothetical protein D3C78_983830 [compost metagenome]
MTINLTEVMMYHGFDLSSGSFFLLENNFPDYRIDISILKLNRNLETPHKALQVLQPG